MRQVAIYREICRVANCAMSMGTPTGGIKACRPVGIPCIDTREHIMQEGVKKLIQFFMPMIPPTVTAQEKDLAVNRKTGKPYMYDSAEIKATKAKFIAYLSQHRPAAPYTGGVRLIVKWCFPRGKHKNGTYKTTKPDTENLLKMLKDCMTKCGFWKDDALVASEINEKFWAEPTGIFIHIEELGGAENA